MEVSGMDAGSTIGADPYGRSKKEGIKAHLRPILPLFISV